MSFPFACLCRRLTEVDFHSHGAILEC